MKQYLYFTLAIVFAIGCEPQDPNQDESGKDIIERNTDTSLIPIGVQYYADTTYISAYSEIYSQTKMRTIPLTVMLSIRSGSFTDTTIINKITYYDTNGTILKEYLTKPIIIKPMQSIDYVVPLSTKDTGVPIKRGGTGAHFIVDWGAKTNTQPIMQCIMHGSIANHSVSFMVPGKSIATKNVKT